MSDMQITEVMLRLTFEHHAPAGEASDDLEASVKHADLAQALALNFPANLVGQRVVSITTETVAAAAARAAEAQLVEQLLAVTLNEHGPLSGDGDLAELTALDLARVYARWWAGWAPYTPEGLKSILGVMDGDRANANSYIDAWFAAVRRAIEDGTLKDGGQ